MVTADGSLETSLSFLTDTHTHRRTALTGVLPEETLGAPKVLPDQCWVSFKIIYKHFIESLGPVYSVHYVGI